MTDKSTKTQKSNDFEYKLMCNPYLTLLHQLKQAFQSPNLPATPKSLEILTSTCFSFRRIT
jgi:hypothetical protein